MKKGILLGAIVLVVAVLFFLVRQEKTIAPDKESNQAQSAQKQSEAKMQSAAEQNKVNDNSTNEQKNMELEIKTIQEGTGERAVKAGDSVSVLYTGKLTDGTIFDASAKHGNVPFEFKVGAGMVIKGWDQGLLGAKVGEKRTLTIPGNLAYGANGIPGVIPPNATLVFDVEIMAIK